MDRRGWRRVEKRRAPKMPQPAELATLERALKGLQPTERLMTVRWFRQQALFGWSKEMKSFLRLIEKQLTQRK